MVYIILNFSADLVGDSMRDKGAHHDLHMHIINLFVCITCAFLCQANPYYVPVSLT